MLAVFLSLVSKVLRLVYEWVDRYRLRRIPPILESGSEGIFMAPKPRLPDCGGGSGFSAGPVRGIKEVVADVKRGEGGRHTSRQDG